MNLLKEYKGAMSYDDYINTLGEYYSLHRWHYEKFLLDEESSEIIKEYNPFKILVITEPWCGDSLAMLPIIRKIAEKNGGWEIKIILRDSNPELMDKFLTDGAKAIPVFLFLDKDTNLFFKWGPRPE